MASQSASRLSYYTLYQVLLLMDFYLKFFFDYITFFFEKKRKIRKSYKFFEELGLKTPKYRFLYGNLKEIMDKGYSSSFHEWTSELGKTYGLVLCFVNLP